MQRNKESMSKGASTEIYRRAKSLRKKETPAEIKLWEHLRNRQLMGVKFRRQHPILHYILDFYSHENKLAIEVDGDIHLEEENKEHDINRSAFLEEHGIKIIRFTNDGVLYNIAGVLMEIQRHLTPVLHSRTSPLLGGEG